MIRIRKATKEDLEPWMKCLRRTLEAMEKDGLEMGEDLTEERFLADSADGRLFLAVDGKRVLASLSVEHNVCLAFFPKSKSQAKTGELLDMVGHQGHPLTIVRGFFVDPAYQRQGIGKLLFHDIQARYKENDFLLSVYEGSGKALPFFLHLGFRNHGLMEMENARFPQRYLLSKMYIEPGLCRNVYW